MTDFNIDNDVLEEIQKGINEVKKILLQKTGIPLEDRWFDSADLVSEFHIHPRSIRSYQLPYSYLGKKSSKKYYRGSDIQARLEQNYKKML